MTQKKGVLKYVSQHGGIMFEDEDKWYNPVIQYKDKVLANKEKIMNRKGYTVVMQLDDNGNYTQLGFGQQEKVPTEYVTDQRDYKYDLGMAKNAAAWIIAQRPAKESMLEDYKQLARDIYQANQQLTDEVENGSR